MSKYLALIFVSTAFALSSCGPTTAELRARESARQQMVIDHFKSYIFTSDEISRSKALPGHSKQKIEAHIRNTLFDPEAGRIRNLRKICLVAAEKKITTSENVGSFAGWLWSGEVNGKNRYGAYVGYQEQQYISVVSMKSKNTGYVTSKATNLILPTDFNIIKNDRGPWNYRVTR